MNTVAIKASVLVLHCLYIYRQVKSHKSYKFHKSYKCINYLKHISHFLENKILSGCLGKKERSLYNEVFPKIIISPAKTVKLRFPMRIQ